MCCVYISITTEENSIDTTWPLHQFVYTEHRNRACAWRMRGCWFSMYICLHWFHCVGDIPWMYTDVVYVWVVCFGASVCLLRVHVSVCLCVCVSVACARVTVCVCLCVCCVCVYIYVCASVCLLRVSVPVCLWIFVHFVCAWVCVSVVCAPVYLLRVRVSVCACVCVSVVYLYVSVPMFCVHRVHSLTCVSGLARTGESPAHWFISGTRGVTCAYMTQVEWNTHTLYTQIYTYTQVHRRPSQDYNTYQGRATDTENYFALQLTEVISKARTSHN